MTRRSQHNQWEPGEPVGRRGWLGAFYPFYQFQQLARDDGKPYQPPEPKAELKLLALLGTRTVVVVMSCLLVVVAFTLIVLLAARLG